jgi:ElaB/YqjD/DUF883 family membrane-anchored ribosome-binding protein
MAKRAETKLSEPRELARSVRKEYENRTDDVRGAAKILREEYDKRVEQVHGRLDQSIDDSRQSVRKHPFLAVGVTLGVGIIAGVLLGRKSKD